MPAVTFNNTQNVGFIVANTAAPRRNLDVAIPPGDVGDAIVVIATANVGSQAVQMNVAGYTTFSQESTPNPSYGELLVAYKVSNGRETSLSVTASGVANYDFCAAVLRFKGAHRIRPISSGAGSGSSTNVASDSVQISTGNWVEAPIGDNSIMVSTICGSNGVPFLDGEQPAGQTFITKANTPSNRLMISYENKQITNSYATKVFANTAGRRRAFTFSVVPDTMSAGARSSTIGSSIIIKNTEATYLHHEPGASHLAGKDEEIGEVGYGLNYGVVGDGSGVDIAIYDVTGGRANAVLMGAQTVNTLRTTSPSTFVQTFYPPIKLTPGRRYSTAVKSKSTTDIGLAINYSGGAKNSLNASITGASSFPSLWNGGNFDYWFHIFAPVRNSRKVHVSSYKFFSNTASQAGTAHTSTFPLYPGASRKIIVMAYSEIVAVGAMTAATFDGQNMSLIATDTLDDPNYFSMWYYDIPNSGVLQDFTTYTEFDPGSDLTLTGTNQINIETMTGTSLGETGYRLDLGVADRKTGDFKYRIGPINVSAATSDTSRFTIFIASETNGSGGGNDEKPSIQVRWNRTLATSNSRLELAHFDSTTIVTTSPKASVTYDGPEVHLNRDFYVEVSRIGTSAYCSLYTDSNYKNLITTLALNNLSVISPMRYVYFAGRWATGTASTVTATIKNAYYMVGEPGNKSITVSTTQPTGNVTWHAWQLNRANTGMPRNSISGQLAGSLAISNTIFATADSFVLATVASSATNGTYTWNYDVINDRQELDEAQYTTAAADAFQYTEGTKTITATSSATDGNKYLGIVCVDTVKSKNKVKSGFVG